MPSVHVASLVASSGPSLVAAFAMLALGCGTSEITFEHSPQSLAPPLLPAAVAVPDKQATIAIRQPHVGEVRAIREVGSISGAAIVDRSRKPIAGSVSNSRRFEVLAVAGDIVTKARVSFPAESTELVIGGRHTPFTPHLRGHSYLVEWRGGMLELTRTDNAPLTAAERNKLLDTVRPLVGAPDFIARAVGGKPLTTGTTIALPTAELAPTLGEEALVRAATVRLIDVRGDVAILEYHVDARILDEGVPHDVVTRTLVQLSMATGDSVGEATKTAVHTERNDREMSIVISTTIVPVDG